jgi:hypothetical protein
VITSSDTLRVDKTPLDGWSTRRRDLYLQQHASFTRDKRPYRRRDSNPQSQQASGHRPMPPTARPPRRHNDYLGTKISSPSTTHWPLSCPWPTPVPFVPSLPVSCLWPPMSNVAASVVMIRKCNVELSSPNVIYIRTHTYTNEDYVVYLRSMTWGKHTNVAQN